MRSRAVSQQHLRWNAADWACVSSFYEAVRSLSPDPLQKQIPVTMRIRNGSRVGAQAHCRRVARGIVGGPVRCCGAVWIARFGKIRPEGWDQVGKLVILRVEC